MATIYLPGLHLFFLAGPGALHEIALSVFSCSPLRRVCTFSCLFRLIPRIYLSVPPPSPCFLALAFPFFLPFLSLPSCTSQTSLWTASSSFPPISFHAFSTTLSYLIPAYPFVTSPPTALSAMAGYPSFCTFFTLYCQFNFLTSLLVLSGHISSFCS